MKFVFLLMFFLSLACFAQKQDSSFVKLSFEYNRMDFFSTLSYGKINKRIQQEIGFGVGINRTFFQQRMYPRIQVRSSFFLMNKKWLKLGLTTSYDFSCLNINKHSRDIHFYNEGLVGFTVETGNKFVLNVIPEVGLILESSRSTITQKYNTIYGFQYALQIGLKYVI